MYATQEARSIFVLPRFGAILAGNGLAMDTLVHQHLVIAVEVDRQSVEEEALGEWLVEVARSVGMRPITKPVISYSDSPGNTGFLGILGISTSHLSVHHWDCCRPSLLQFDLYSCKPFEIRTVLQEVNRFWSVQDGEIAVLNRGRSYEAALDLSRQGFFAALEGPVPR